MKIKGKTVEMSMGEFVKEHEHLVPTLRSGSSKQRKAEATEQASELAKVKASKKRK